MPRSCAPIFPSPRAAPRPRRLLAGSASLAIFTAAKAQQAADDLHGLQTAEPKATAVPNAMLPQPQPPPKTQTIVRDSKNGQFVKPEEDKRHFWAPMLPALGAYAPCVLSLCGYMCSSTLGSSFFAKSWEVAS